MVSLAAKKNTSVTNYGIKSVSRQKVKKDVEMLETELSTLQKTDHPNVIQFHEIFRDDTHIHFVMEFCSGGDLFEYLMDREFLDEVESCFMIIKLISAIQHLHERNICHRDLKIENILLESSIRENTGKKGKFQKYPNIKLIDFGLSKILNSSTERMKTKLGTPYYVSPEILMGDYDKNCDMWSVGVICYVLLCGCPPFNANNELKLFSKILSCQYDFSHHRFSEVSSEACNFIRKLL